MADLWFSFKPLSSWPGERSRARRRLGFSADYGRTTRELLHEIKHLKGTDPIIEAECGDEDINLRTGMLKSTAKLRGPGIVVSFDSKFGPLRYPCDTSPVWQENLRAVVNYLKNQRINARYGVGRVEQIYKGYKALPEAGIVAGEWPNLEDAARFLCTTAWGPDATGEGYIGPTLGTNGYRNDLDIVYRAAARKAHPDAGGSNELMAKVNRAREFIEKHGRSA